MTQDLRDKYMTDVKVNSSGYLVVTVQNLHNKYKNHPRRKSKTLDYKTYRAVLEFMFKRVWYYMITELWVFKPPHNFGEFYIAEIIGSNGFYKNWKRTKEEGKLVKEYNLHTRGKRFFTKWNKRLAKIRNKSCYSFSAYRGNKEEIVGKRGIAGWVKECANDPTKKDYRPHIN